MTNPDNLFPVSEADLGRLRDELAERAGEIGELDVVYRIADSPLGPLLIAATDRGLVRVAFECESFDTVLASLAEKVSPRMMRAPGLLDDAVGQLDAYFSGARRTFELPLDLRLSAGFRQSVQRFLPQISYGQTRTYKEVAAAVGNPGAVRAVGTACAQNPLPVVLPCHRVLRTDGGLGGYLGGVPAKMALLELERAH